MDNPEDLWKALLSGDEALVRRVWNDLTDDEASAISDHLKHMAADQEFSEEQKEAARRALEAIQRAG